MEGNKNCKIKGRTPSTGQSSLLSLYRIKKISVVLHYMLQILRMMKVFVIAMYTQILAHLTK